MSIQEYLSEPLEKRKQIVIEANPNKCVIWLERLQTAVNTSNPASVMFSKELSKEYWNLKTNKS